MAMQKIKLSNGEVLVVGDRKHPNRISCWLSDDDMWVHDALAQMAKELTALGQKTSKSDVIRLILVDKLQKAGYGRAKKTDSGVPPS